MLFRSNATVFEITSISLYFNVKTAIFVVLTTIRAFTLSRDVFFSNSDADGKPLRCKIESWQVRYGYVYGFSEVGEPNLDKFPEAKAMLSKLQIPHLKSVHVEKWEADGKVYKLAGPETWHFMQAGPQGAIVTEYASTHDNAGLRFTVPGTAL